MKYQILTFGCQMNVSDSIWLEQALNAQGHVVAEQEDEAEFFIVNTCSVREKPEQKVYSLLGRLRDQYERNPAVFVCVGGCVAQQVGTGFLERFPFVRLVFGPDGLVMVPSALQRLLDHDKLKLSLLDFSEHYPQRDNYLPDTLPPQAYVNIMQGCNNFCAYCIVPYTRGRQKSRAAQDIVQECQELIARGVKEITLLGQNVNSYGQDNHAEDVTFAQLLELIDALPGLKRLRFTTSHPKDMSSDVINSFKSLHNLCPSLHLPLQSGSDNILKAMGRKYNQKQYLNLIDMLREACPDITMTTDLMVGFPGETDGDFQDTLHVMNRVGFDSSFSFKYSDRPGVRSAQMEPKISEAVKTERLQILQKLQEDWTLKKLQSRIGRKDEILIEGLSKKQAPEAVFWKGRDSGGRVVNILFNTSEDQTGRIVEVIFTRAKKHSLEGEALL
ncbi:tRNA (N6-isopentenyl adenosine(37)-C2)-methylthiotransferase MiaB [Desulfonatronovibrio magnus]|uniref:tRNA (N6-isopentenyl adenosine(37)-C2)-methylthiotransferase MiaB n=1 Tax=Desulfonatronovibrio magnus TaxID=698827 RepID=UPI000697E8AE|nr:tRNA (N6-isopentenyl adenosine(37)-C2)-methylthiotransferase MiaB [Desulfonatronovibrio magnus]